MKAEGLMRRRGSLRIDLRAVCPHRAVIPIIFCLLTTSAFADSDREQIIENELKCVNTALQKGVTWADVCQTSHPEFTIESVKPRKKRGEAIGDAQKMPQTKPGKESVSVKPQKTSGPEAVTYRGGSLIGEQEFEGDDAPTWKLEFGPEVYDYEYTERIGVKDTGIFYGLSGSYTYWLSHNEPIYSWRDIFSGKNNLNLFRIEARAATGEIDYEGTGTWNDIRDAVGEIRALAGYDIFFNENFRFTPFVGGGYRYLFDNFSEVPARTIDGVNYLSGYDRESQYIYIPIGGEIETGFGRGWKLQVKGEYDYLLKGKQKSHLENSKNAAGVGAGFDTLENDQEDGYGIRGSIRLTKETDGLDFFIEPFIRYWHIDDSESDFIAIGGQLVCEGNLCLAGLEPDNETTEMGVKLGIQY